MTPQQPTDANPARALSLSQRVVEGLTRRIDSGALKPGERVPTEPELMREFGVSRSVVREAVSRLQAGGLLRTQHGVGSFVLAPQPVMPLLAAPDAAHMKMQQKLAMLELRLSLEVEAAALAAQRRTPAQLSGMERALGDFEAQLANDDATAASDFRFHELISQATGNEYFVHVLRTLSGATIPRAAAGARRPPIGKARKKEPRFGEPSPQLRHGKELAAQEHRAVLDAIRRGDASMARAAMYMHLTNSRERMKAADR
jgi:DNA-binding FadR family transcriptional regulator